MTDCTHPAADLGRAARGDASLARQPAPAPQDGAPPDRPLGQALRRGWRRRCPSCGSGPMFSGYLAVRDACPVCGLDLTHQRADDGPAYLTILVVGHLLAPVILWMWTAFRPDPLVMASILAVGTVALSLWLLPRIKGGLVALQWAKRMHGFGREPDPEA